MALAYRTTPLPEVWPAKEHRTKRPAPFKANWGGTLDLLEREIRHLNGRDVTLAIGVTPGDIRVDGCVRAAARVRNPAVVLTFRAGPDQLSFPCDRFNFWQDNVRAIALALEALRKVDRYGVQAGRQYQGFRALGAGTVAPRTPAQAAERVARFTGFDFDADVVLQVADAARDAIRHAHLRVHPDRGGTNGDFADPQECKRILSAHHGASL